MSENTNSMFWIICGAVVVLSAFTLINSRLDTTITAIFEHFDSVFTVEE